MKYNPNWFQSVEKKVLQKAPPFSKTLQIDRIATGSPAADLGLRPGDKLLSLNGKAALIVDIPKILATSPTVQYRFFLPRETALLEVATQGLPLGIETHASSDGIVEQYKSKGAFEKEGLLTLWEREDYDHIRQSCALSNKRLNKGNFVGKLTGKQKTFPFTDVMTAICEIESGNAKAGYEALGDYTTHHAHGETSDVRAVLNYYHGLNAKAEKRIEGYQRLIGEAYASYHQSERIRHEAVKAGVEIDRADNRVGRIVPTSQSWTLLEGGHGSRNLKDILDSLGPKQVLPLCLMTTYRGNGPYNDALLPYIALQPNVSEQLHPLVVLTNVAEKRKDRPYWNSHEDLAKKVNCPFIVMHGSFDDIVETFAPRAAPEFFVIDKGGKIIWAGELATDYDYWDMLSKVAS